MRALYQSLLMHVHPLIPSPIQSLHSSRMALGRASVRRGRSPIANLIARILGLPSPGRVPLVIRFRQRQNGEIWERRFGQRVFTTRQWADADCLMERAGPLTLTFRLVVAHRRLNYVLEHGYLFGVPLPRALWPRIRASELACGGQVAFRVATALPWVGPIVAYRGTIARMR